VPGTSTAPVLPLGNGGARWLRVGQGLSRTTDRNSVGIALAIWPYEGAGHELCTQPIRLLDQKNGEIGAIRRLTEVDRTAI
jgi:hypothetical protein